MTSAQLADRLLEEFGVATIGGSAFGALGERRLRLSFASAQSELDEAVRRIRECVARLGTRGPSGGRTSAS